MLRGLARRDQGEFMRWRATLSKNATEARLLSPTLYQAFREVVERRFDADVDVREITHFLLTPRVGVAPEWRLPLLESEALIRSALGERGLVEGIDGVLVHEVRMQLFVHIVEDLAMSTSELDEVLTAAEQYVTEERAVDPRGGI
jgi:hypothetical protein